VSQVFRLFISSTFDDWKVEREYLRHVTFPKLKKYCEKRGARFLPIDLRWGVSEEACHTHDTVEICLEEVHRCQRLTPKPNFLVFQGDRYGWRPIPKYLKGEYAVQVVASKAFNDEKLSETFYRWYDKKPDENVGLHILHEVEKIEGGEFSKEAWKDAEALLRSLFV